MVREAGVGDRAIVLELEDPPSRTAADQIDRAAHLSWVLSSPRELALDALPRRSWQEARLESGLAEEADWQPTSMPSELQGHYVAPGTGHVLVVSGNGRYRYYDSLTADELVAADRGELESDPGTVTGSCTGGSFSGRLLSELRGRLGLVYSAGSEYATYSDAGAWYASAGVDPANLGAAVDAVRAEIARLRQAGIV